MNITASIHTHARLRPRAPAIIAPAGSLTFAQLDAFVWRLAARFRDEGLQAGQGVMVDVGDPVKHLIVTLALARLGVAHLANFVGQNASAMAPLMARVGVVRTISEKAVREEAFFAGAPERERVNVPLIAGEMAQHADTPWLYVTSSGTTGRPKIVAITHRMMAQRLARHALSIPMFASDRFLPLSDLAFYLPKAHVMGTLDSGGCVVFMGGLELEPGLEFMRRERLTRITCAPVHLHPLCALGESRRELLLPQLRALYVSTAMVSDELRRRTRQTVSPNVYVAYGTMEAPALTVAPPEVEVADTIGSVLPRVRLEVVDAGDKPLPFGETGVIRVRAAGNATSYHDDAEASAQSFRDGWFYPGDLGLLTDDGQVIYKGRADDMMVFDGINVYPAEIESVLTEHAAVAEAAAFPLQSDVHQDWPVAAVTLRAPVTTTELLAYCREQLGQRAPQRIIVVKEFPRSAAGKILKRELPGLLKDAP